MTRRTVFYAASLAVIMAAATLASAPLRPILAPLPADWPDLSDSPRIEVSVFPSAAVYPGEQAGLRAETDFDPAGRKLQVRMDSPSGPPLAETDLFINIAAGNWGIHLPWIWDSAGQAGWHTLFVSLGGRPDDPRAEKILVQYPLQVLPGGRPAAGGAGAAWMETESGCCIYYFLSGTEAARDMERLVVQTEEVYAALSVRIGEAGAPARDAPTHGEAALRAIGIPVRGNPAHGGAAWNRVGFSPRNAGPAPKMAIAFLPRMYGQGGLATAEGILSYTDRNYTGTDFSILLKHELVHLFSAVLYPAGPRPPMLLQEGLAVYLTGGHYRAPEALPERAEALVRAGKFLPLAELADTFPSAQHETAYLEAGAFVEYLAGRYGAERLWKMLRDPIDGGSAGRSLDAMLSRHFGRTLAQVEAAWLDALRSRPPDPDTERDVAFTIRLFEALRKYQRLYDPGALSSEMWLPDTAQARERRITADYLPVPATAERIALETMLRAARSAADGRDWARAQETLAAVEQVLEAKQRRSPDPVHVSPEAECYRRLAEAILNAGNEPLSITMEDGAAETEVRDPESLQKEDQRWVLVRGSWVRAG